MSGVQETKQEEKDKKGQNQELEKINLPVSGLHCANCALRIEKALGGTPGVKQASVNLASNTTLVVFDRQQVSESDLVKKIDGLGYKSVTDRAELPVKGLSCASCVNRVETALLELKGVVGASANLALGKVSVEFIPGEVSLTEMKKAIEQAGYEVPAVVSEEPVSQVEKQAARELSWLKRQLAVGTVWSFSTAKFFL